MYKKKGVIFVISGPSGSGKTTLAKRLLLRKEFKGALVRSVSFTTRKPRAGERSGRDYFFISKKEFLLKKSKGEFLEWTMYLNCYYATSRKFIEDQLEKKKSVIFSIDIKGASNIKKFFPKDAVSVFILPPSMDVLEKRLRDRHSEKAEHFTKRLKIAEGEIRRARRYDYKIVNRHLKSSVNELASILLKEIKKRNR